MDLSAAVSSAGTALEFLKTALKARDQAVIDKAVADMVDQLRNVNMAALEASQEALKGAREARQTDQRIAELESEIRVLKTEADERGKYHLAQVGNNSFAYTFKDSPPEGQQRHYLCQACYDNGGKKIVLQRIPGRSILKCPTCESEIQSEALQAEIRQQREAARQRPRRMSNYY
ncbi:hypothetical protein A9R05_27770 [Burkholderia sp. KK1]|nr:hypothetical protein A9R05_27770 [Burkholderia sp. KK1]